MKLLIDDIEVAWPKKIEIQVQGEFEEVPSLEIEIHGGKLWVTAKNIGAGLFLEDREVVCSGLVMRMHCSSRPLPPRPPGHGYGIRIAAGNTGDGINAGSSADDLPKPDVMVTPTLTALDTARFASGVLDATAIAPPEGPTQPDAVSGPSMSSALARIEEIQRGMRPVEDGDSLKDLREARSGGMS